jgi:hypothetical protein
LCREPLLHFVVLGALLFGLYGWLHRGRGAPQEIVVSSSQVDSLRAQFERLWQRPPTPDELTGLVDAWVRDEVLYREGQAMGLDRDDPVIRRRVAQKVDFLAEGSTPPQPTDAELEAWLDSHSDAYRVEGRYSLRQVYFDPSRHRDRLDMEVAAAKRALGAGGAASGDATMLPSTLEAATSTDVARVFGTEFAEALHKLPVGHWSGPVRSGFGVHLVLVSAVEPSRRATLDEARTAVERDLLHDRTEKGKAAFYDSLLAKYKVRVEAPAGRGLPSVAAK